MLRDLLASTQGYALYRDRYSSAQGRRWGKAHKCNECSRLGNFSAPARSVEAVMRNPQISPLRSFLHGAFLFFLAALPFLCLLLAFVAEAAPA